jgi:hypothetical protein
MRGFHMPMLVAALASSALFASACPQPRNKRLDVERARLARDLTHFDAEVAKFHQRCTPATTTYDAMPPFVRDTFSECVGDFARLVSRREPLVAKILDIDAVQPPESGPPPADPNKERNAAWLRGSDVALK